VPGARLEGRCLRGAGGEAGQPAELHISEAPALPLVNKLVGLACKRIVQLTNVSVAWNYLLPVIALPEFSIHNLYFGECF
jgi:hypothetical protein